MSKAGIQSNPGDGYLTLLTFDWALTVQTEPDFQWLEVDSVTSPVDEVVVGEIEDVRMCCQGKKNQCRYKACALGDLKVGLGSWFISISSKKFL